jgi:cytidine deaminase
VQPFAEHAVGTANYRVAKLVTVIASNSGPLKPCSACRSRTALTAACSVAWHVRVRGATLSACQ